MIYVYYILGVRQLLCNEILKLEFNLDLKVRYFCLVLLLSLLSLKKKMWFLNMQQINSGQKLKYFKRSCLYL